MYLMIIKVIKKTKCKQDYDYTFIKIAMYVNIKMEYLKLKKKTL